MEPDQDPRAEPEESGVEPVQRVPVNDRDVVVIKSQARLPDHALSDAISGLAGSGGVRGIQPLSLIEVSVRSMERALARANSESEELRQDVKGLQESLKDAERRSAVLAERLRSAKEQRRTRSVLTTIGGIIAGAAGSRLGSPGSEVAMGAFLLGVVMLVFGFLPDRGEKGRGGE